MDIDGLIDTMQSPEDMVAWMALNRAYQKPSDYQEKYLAAVEQPDTTRKLAEDLVDNKSAACANFAALAAYTARKKGIPGGVIYVKTPEAEVGHDYAYWRNQQGQIVLASNNKIEKVYPSFLEFTQAMGSVKGQKDALVYLSDDRGKLITDPKDEKKYLLDLANKMGGGAQRSEQQSDQDEALRDSEGIDYTSQ